VLVRVALSQLEMNFPHWSGMKQAKKRLLVYIGNTCRNGQLPISQLAKKINQSHGHFMFGLTFWQVGLLAS
jgi:hypothetical protein